MPEESRSREFDELAELATRCYSDDHARLVAYLEDAYSSTGFDVEFVRECTPARVLALITALRAAKGGR
jgi:hypothetical protein